MESSAPRKLLVETAWEVCNQVGGIYTVIRSKLPVITKSWGSDYCLIGPYIHPDVTARFEPTDEYDNPFGKVVLKMREMGYEVHFGRWLVSGRPLVVLFDPRKLTDRLGDAKYRLWEHHQIGTPHDDSMIDQVVLFGELIRLYFSLLADQESASGTQIIGHFHEWMAGTAIPDLRRENVNIRIVFTTHATLLGRYLAMNDPGFYGNLPFYDWQKEAAHFNIEPSVRIERAAAHGAHVLTTVSELTANECEYLLGRKAQVILPNGLNINRFAVVHEVQNLHHKFKTRINEFVMGHFFQSYHFDLNNTLYFFTSGRYEYKNKGYDLTLEALRRLNERLKQAGSDLTIVMFFITKRPFYSINPDVLHSRAVMLEIRQTCDIIVDYVRENFFNSAASGSSLKMPDLNEFVPENWRLRLRRNLQSWKSDGLPSVITHNLVDDSTDEILGFLRSANLVNHPSDRVKVVYHPDFLSPTNPFFGIEYGEFVRGCHLGIFPSYYEPWGYTPVECLASGVPAITSDLAGFGNYLLHNLPEAEGNAIRVVERHHKSFDEAAEELTDKMFDFVLQKQRDRISQRYVAEKLSMQFDWEHLISHYETAYEAALG
jgi:glycogen(starch) synthase